MGGFKFDESFWVAVATLLFVILVFKPIKRAIIALVDKRIEEISGELDEAKRLKEKAQEILAEAEQKLAKSEKDSSDIIRHAEEEAKQIIIKSKAKLASDIEVRKKLALQKIKNFEDNAVNDIKKSIADITVNAATSILEENLDDKKSKKLLEDSIDKISKTLH